MGKKIVIALGGNALGNNLSEQKAAVKTTASAIVDLIEEGNTVIITHGNGPQVGMLKSMTETAHKENSKLEDIPLPVCVSMSQAYIGSDLQNALSSELLKRGINKNVTAVITHTVVDKNDKAFENKTKPIGTFVSEEEAKELIKKGLDYKEDSGRGWRLVVASPKPIDIIEKNTIKNLVDNGIIPIAVGGGGIPVIRNGNELEEISAVIDKDFASSFLASEIDADMLIILTAVSKVSINFGKENQKELDVITISDAEKYISEGHFAPGSMLPKITAAMNFVSSGKNKTALITLLEKAKDALNGKTGTTIVS